MKAEVQCNYPKFKKDLAKKENFVISKVSESQSLLSKIHDGAASFKNLTFLC